MLKAVLAVAIFCVFSVDGGKEHKHAVDFKGDAGLFWNEIQAIKCQDGFKMIPVSLVSAMTKCALGNKGIIKSLPCFKACVFNILNFDSTSRNGNGTTSIDIGAIDMLAMDAFHMDTPEGRSGYWNTAKNAHKCSEEYLADPSNTLPKTFTVNADCEKPDTLYKCFTAFLKEKQC